MLYRFPTAVTPLPPWWPSYGTTFRSSRARLICSSSRRSPPVTEKLSSFSDAEVLEAIEKHRQEGRKERPVKQVELDALLAAPEGFGDDVPIDPDFHARRLPEKVWRRSDMSSGVGSVTQVHRLREVMALVGFTRLEAVTPDIDGEYETDVERADLALEPQWFPAVENRGEGVFLRAAPDRRDMGG